MPVGKHVINIFDIVGFDVRFYAHGVHWKTLISSNLSLKKIK